jgi:RNA polymerase sigma factor (sigma-70 family)
MTTSRSQDLDALKLLENEGWVRRLAIAMVGDNSEADDVVQQTWLNALLWPPRRGGDLRGWLATVVRNVVRQRARGERSESRRRLRVARPDIDPGDLDSAERLELHGQVTRAVHSLRALDREVLVLRYYDDLTPTQIAERSELPVSTVKSRLARARQRLAARLDNSWEGGQRGVGWRSGLMLIAFGRTGAPELLAAGATPAVAGLSLGTVGSIFGVAFLCAGALFWWGGEGALLDQRETAAAVVGQPVQGAGLVSVVAPWKPTDPLAAEPVPRPIFPPIAPAGARKAGPVGDGLEPDVPDVPETLRNDTPAEEPAWTAPISDGLGIAVSVRCLKAPAPDVDLLKNIALMASDPVCSGFGEEANLHPIVDPNFRIDEHGGLADVFVQITGLPEERPNPPKTPVVLDQIGCLFEPRVFGLVKGQSLVMRNSDNTLHNVHTMPEKNRPWNFVFPAKGMSIEKRFKKAEEAIPIVCDVHPWMAAWCFVMNHPFFAVTGADGTALIQSEGIPDGNYNIVAWHATLGRTEAPLLIKNGRAKVELSFP